MATAGGHDVHSAEMMRAIAAKGHAVVFLSRTPPDAVRDRRPGSERLSKPLTPDARDASSDRQVYRRGFSGIGALTPAMPQRVARACRTVSVPTSWSSVGLDALPYLVGPTPCGARLVRRRRVGAASPQSGPDCWIARPGSTSSRPRKGRLPAGLRRSVDRMWVVTERDAGRRRWIAGAETSMSSPNGVDVALLRPEAGRGAAEHGRLLGPTRFRAERSGAQWFVRQVWPAVREPRPEALFRIIGFKPGDGGETACGRAGRRRSRQTCRICATKCAGTCRRHRSDGFWPWDQEQAARGRGDGVVRSLHDEGNARPRPAGRRRRW